MDRQNKYADRRESLTQLQWLAVALVVVTGVLHAYAGVVEGRIPVALAGYQHHRETVERYTPYLPTVSAAVLVTMGVGFAVGVL